MLIFSAVTWTRKLKSGKYRLRRGCHWRTRLHLSRNFKKNNNSSISCLYDVWCLAMFTLLPKEFLYRDNKAVLYSVVLNLGEGGGGRKARTKANWSVQRNSASVPNHSVTYKTLWLYGHGAQTEHYCDTKNPWHKQLSTATCQDCDTKCTTSMRHNRHSAIRSSKVCYAKCRPQTNTSLHRLPCCFCFFWWQLKIFAAKHFTEVVWYYMLHSFIRRQNLHTVMYCDLDNTGSDRVH